MIIKFNKQKVTTTRDASSLKHRMPCRIKQKNRLEEESLLKMVRTAKKVLTEVTYSQNHDMAHSYMWIRNHDNKDSRQEEIRSI